MNFFIYTLGCKVNQYEGEAIQEAWENAGAVCVQESIVADVILINSCAVTENSLKDVRKFFTTLEKHNFSGKIILTGCATKLLEKELTTYISLTTVSQAQKATLLQFPSEINSPVIVENTFTISRSTRARPTVKVQDGCSHKCTYCIIPYTRGASVSRSIKDILEEIRRLLNNGYQEITLSGINLRQFGLDYVLQIDFWDLLYKIEKEFALEWQGKARIRLSSLEPCQLNAKAMDILGQSSLVCPHLHVSLQSASPFVLERMGRSHYTADMIEEALETIQQFWPIMGFGVDIITGFPQETEEEFRTTQVFLEKLPLTYGHIFPFSERPFTKAREMEGQVYPHLRKERAKILRAIVQHKQEQFLDFLLHNTIPQNCISEKTHSHLALSEYYVHCRYNTIPSEERMQVALPIKRENSILIVQA